MDRFDAMRLFARIVELGSFSRAAEQLGLPRASATLTIQRLEARLGARLLARTTRHVRPTADGSAYYERCVAILAELEDAESVFLDAARKPQGRVRVDVSGSFARHVLMHSPVLNDVDLTKHTYRYGYGKKYGYGYGYGKNRHTYGYTSDTEKS